MLQAPCLLAALLFIAKKYRQKYRHYKMCLFVEGLNRIVPGFCFYVAHVSRVHAVSHVPLPTYKSVL